MLLMEKYSHFWRDFCLIKTSFQYKDGETHPFSRKERKRREGKNKIQVKDPSTSLRCTQDDKIAISQGLPNTVHPWAPEDESFNATRTRLWDNKNAFAIFAPFAFFAAKKEEICRPTNGTLPASRPQ